MKFQNCILINFVTDGRTRTSRKQYAPSTFPKLGGIKRPCETQLFMLIKDLVKNASVLNKQTYEGRFFFMFVEW